MENIQKMLIGLGLLALSGNAAAIMISGKMDNEYKEMDLSMQAIAGLLGDYQAESKQESKYLKKAYKHLNKLSNLKSKMAAAGFNEKKAAKMAKKALKKEQKLGSFLNKLDLDLTAFMVADVGPATLPPSTKTTGGEEPEGETKSVPEPSTIALLGIGLAGFAAARRLKRQS